MPDLGGRAHRLPRPGRVRRRRRGFAAYTRRRRLAESAENAILASFLAALVASGVLLAALLRHDFSFVYVWKHTSLELPRPYTFGVLGWPGGIAAPGS